MEDLILIGQGPESGLPSFNADCGALDCHLHFLALNFSSKPTNTHLISPTGRLPLLSIGGTKAIGGLEECIRFLQENGNDLHAHLSIQERITCEALADSVRVRLGGLLNYLLFVDEPNFDAWTYPRSSSHAPWLLKFFGPSLERRTQRTRLAASLGSGSSSFSGSNEELETELLLRARNSLQSLSSLLSSTGQPFFFGSRPTSLDAVAFAYLSSHLYFPIPNNPLRDEIIDHHPLLIAFCQSILATHYPHLQDQRIDLKSQKRSTRPYPPFVSVNSNVKEDIETGKLNSESKEEKAKDDKQKVELEETKKKKKKNDKMIAVTIACIGAAIMLFSMQQDQEQQSQQSPSASEPAESAPSLGWSSSVLSLGK